LQHIVIDFSTQSFVYFGENFDYSRDSATVFRKAKLLLKVFDYSGIAILSPKFFIIPVQSKLRHILLLIIP